MLNNVFQRFGFMALISLVALLLFGWPLFISAQSQTEIQFAQLAFMALMPAILIITITEFSSGRIDARQLAILGVLTAVNAFIRMLGAGAAGVETAFFLIILSSYVFGSSFGFLMGACSLFVSALITGGVGPWLPFQMMAAGIIGVGAGLLPKFKKLWSQMLVLILYGVLGAYLYGALMTLWNWPFLAGVGSDVSYAAGAGVIENLKRFLNYEILTGGLIWDTGRAITTSILIVVTAPALLTTLRRASNRAGMKKF